MILQVKYYTLRNNKNVELKKDQCTTGQGFSTQTAVSSGLLAGEHLLLVIPSIGLHITFLRFMPSPHVTEHCEQKQVYLMQNVLNVFYLSIYQLY